MDNGVTGRSVRRWLVKLIRQTRLRLPSLSMAVSRCAWPSGRWPQWWCGAGGTCASTQACIARPPSYTCQLKAGKAAVGLNFRRLMSYPMRRTLAAAAPPQNPGEDHSPPVTLCSLAGVPRTRRPRCKAWPGASLPKGQRKAADDENDNSKRSATNLVVYLVGCVGKLDALFEDAANLWHLLAFGPVVKGAGNVYLLGGMRPVEANTCQLNHLSTSQGACAQMVSALRRAIAMASRGS